MKTSINKLIPFFAFFLLFAVGCEVEKIDDPFEGVDLRWTDQDCTFALVGKVVDANELIEENGVMVRKPIAEAEVKIGANGISVFTDANGEYRYDLNAKFMRNSLPYTVSVVKDGYVLSTTQIRFQDFMSRCQSGQCLNTNTSILADFAITAKNDNLSGIDNASTSTVEFSQPCIFQNLKTLPVSGDTYTQITSGSEAEYSITFPAGTFNGTPVAQMTPLSPDQVLGQRALEAPLKMFDLQFENLNSRSSEAITVSFGPDYVTPSGSGFGFYSYNAETDTWEAADANVSMASGVVSVEMQAASGQYLVTDKGQTVELAGDEVDQLYNAECNVDRMDFDGNIHSDDWVENSNCLCSATRSFESTHNWYVNFPKNPRMLEPTEQSDVMSTDHITRLLNLPVSAIRFEPLSEEFAGTLPRCHAETNHIFYRDRVLEGTYNGEPFEININAGCSSWMTMDVCTYPTECHQGCPN